MLPYQFKRRREKEHERKREVDASLKGSDVRKDHGAPLVYAGDDSGDTRAWEPLTPVAIPVAAADGAGAATELVAAVAAAGVGLVTAV